jgi:hypothetical protein
MRDLRSSDLAGRPEMLRLAAILDSAKLTGWVGTGRNGTMTNFSERVLHTAVTAMSKEKSQHPFIGSDREEFWPGTKAGAFPGSEFGGSSLRWTDTTTDRG